MSQPSIIRSDDLRSENRRRVLDALRSAGSCTPAKLADLTSLSAASISTLSSQMIEQGILLSDKHPDAHVNNARGRPKSRLSLNPLAGDIVTLTLTINMILIQRVDYAGTVVQSAEVMLDTRDLSEQQLLDALSDAVDTVCPLKVRHQLRHIGVGFQGTTEHASGDLLWSPIVSHRNIPMGSMLHAKFGVTNSVNNDCSLISHALSHQHAESLGRSFATVLFSHGIGLALHLDGQPFAGTRSSALELGHLLFERNGAVCRCGKRGCIEAYAANYGIVRLANGQSVDDAPDGRVSDASMQQLIKQAQQGERAAMQAFTIAGAAVGEGLASLFTLLDPMPIALVGHSDEAFILMQSGINASLQQNLRKDIKLDGLLHCFDNDHALLDQGLVLHSLSQVDRLFSAPTINLSIST